MDNLPKTHRALVQLEYGQPLQVLSRPVPQPTPGSAIVKVLSASVITYMQDIYNGNKAYPYPTPLVAGTSCVGRIVATGPDATLLAPGQLVRFDMTIRGRDDPDAVFLSGIMQGRTAGSAKLMAGEWRDSTFAEYAKLPLENLFPLNEALLTGRPQDGGYGYTVDDLTYVSSTYVSAGGLRDIDLKPGETVIVAPATGGFGRAAVHLALAMGAKVIAMGRSREKLVMLKQFSDRVQTVLITGDMEADRDALKQFGPIDCYFDISPPEATDSTHFKSCVTALRPGGRMSAMGGVDGDIPFPLRYCTMFNIQVKGKWMYDSDVIAFVDRLVEAGNLKIGAAAGFPAPNKFKLEEWEAAFANAKQRVLMGELTVINPQS